MQRLINPLPQFLDSRGALLDGGSIYIGTAGQNPETSPKTVYWDSALSQVASQPLRTLGGHIINGETPAQIFLADGDYSLRIRDADGSMVANVTSVATATAGSEGGDDEQPQDSDLTAIAALTTTAFGRNLLTLANAAALRSAAGIPDSLALTGGTVTGNIVRAGAGVHPYFADAAMTGGRIYVTAAGASDPTSQPGDIWLTY